MSEKKSSNSKKTSSNPKALKIQKKIHYKIDDKHKIDESKIPLLDKELFDYVFKNKPLFFSHLKKDFEKADFPLNRILKDNTPELKYFRRRNDFKKTIHWGQLKLHLSEIEFLTLVHKEFGKTNFILSSSKLRKNSRNNLNNKIGSNESKEKQIYFIYAGSAPGHHIPFLHKLFPDVKFELYDPNPFVLSNNDYINIHTGDPDGFFTNQTAKYWRAENHPDKYIVFCSDIRTEPATPENVKQNMEMQLEWWKIMNPELSIFKFRLPWTDEKSSKDEYTEYPKGDIYIQVYPGHTSTETRLIVKKNAEIKKYYHAKYEKQLFYHNRITRKLYYKNILGNLTLENDGICNCYDCVSFIEIIKQYLEVMREDKKIDKIKLYKLIMKNINYINKRDNLISKTIYNLNFMLNNLLSIIYFKCDKKICNICKPVGYKEKNMSIAKHDKTILIVDD